MAPGYAIPMASGRRWRLATILSIAAALSGMAIGGWFGARVLAPGDAGVGVAAVAIGGAFNGGVVGIVLALLASWRLSETRLARLTATVGGFALVCLLLGAWSSWRRHQRQAAAEAEVLARLPSFQFEIENFGTQQDEQTHLHFDGDDATLRIRNRDGSTCVGNVYPHRRIGLLRALRRVEALRQEQPDPCAPLVPTHRLTFRIGDVSSAPEQVVFFSSACAAQHPELRTLVADTQRAHASLQRDGACP